MPRPEHYEKELMSAEQVAQILHVSRQRILQIERKALAKLRIALGARFNVRSVGDIIGEDVGEAMQPQTNPRR
jgi:DNA-binding XRE family transcriptional regulator